MRTPIIASVAVALILLSGCASADLTPSAASPAASTPTASAAADSTGQSLSEACDAIGTTMDDAAKPLDAAMTGLATDPKKSLAALRTFTTTLETAVAELGNPEVKAQGEKAVAAMNGLNAALEDIIKHPAKAKTKDLKAALATVETELTAIGTVCGG